MSRDINIYIDKIVLEDIGATDTKALKHLIEKQLSSLITEKGLLNHQFQSANRKKMNGGLFKLQSTKAVESTGRGIAEGIYKAIQGSHSNEAQRKPKENRKP